MKNTRKKMLLSSIAMLLVALVALGSATFAWYITNATVTAQTSTWNASTADGLVIRHGISGDWKAKLEDLHTKSDLTPASITYGAMGATLYGATGSGTSFTDGTLSGDLSAATVPQDTTGAPATSNEYFLVDTFYVASSTTTQKTASFTVKGAQVEGTYLNVAIYVNGKLKKVLTSDTAISSTGTTSKVGGTSSAPETASDTQELTAMSASGVNIGNITATAKADNQSGAKIDIVAFADGYNTKCTNEKANVSNVNLTYSFSVVNS